jgi:hypothetical protein
LQGPCKRQTKYEEQNGLEFEYIIVPAFRYDDIEDEDDEDVDWEKDAEREDEEDAIEEEDELKEEEEEEEARKEDEHFGNNGSSTTMTKTTATAIDEDGKVSGDASIITGTEKTNPFGVWDGHEVVDAAHSKKAKHGVNGALAAVGVPEEKAGDSVNEGSAGNTESSVPNNEAATKASAETSAKTLRTEKQEPVQEKQQQESQAQNAQVQQQPAEEYTVVAPPPRKRHSPVIPDFGIPALPEDSILNPPMIKIRKKLIKATQHLRGAESKLRDPRLTAKMRRKYLMRKDKYLRIRHRYYFKYASYNHRMTLRKNHHKDVWPLNARDWLCLSIVSVG